MTEHRQIDMEIDYQGHENTCEQVPIEDDEDITILAMNMVNKPLPPPPRRPTFKCQYGVPERDFNIATNLQQAPKPLPPSMMVPVRPRMMHVRPTMLPLLLPVQPLPLLPVQPLPVQPLPLLPVQPLPVQPLPLLPLPVQPLPLQPQPVPRQPYSKIVPCVICKEFIPLNCTNEHFDKHVKDLLKEYGPRTCRLCLIWFKNTSTLQAHMLTHSAYEILSPQNKISDYQLYPCVHCGISSTSITQMNLHLQHCKAKKRSYAYADMFSRVAQMIISEKLAKAQQYICMYCEKPFITPIGLNRHLEKVHLI